ncbi:MULTISPECIES: hypothetical protein [unclassified Bradyrhizobium]|nr:MULTISPECIES: hypothetical protein [unclassified Bradyrhizobium]
MRVTPGAVAGVCSGVGPQRDYVAGKRGWTFDAQPPTKPRLIAFVFY